MQSCNECLAYTTRGNSDAVITVGIYKDGEFSYMVYGENGRELEPKLHTYEIGSITKTITAAYINKAELEGRLNLTDTIDKYLNLPKGKKYPTIEELLTHTSGYDGYYVGLINHYLMALGMDNSRFTMEQGDLGNCWRWEMRDAYAPAGAIHSDVEDMLTFAKLQLTDESMQKMHEPLREIRYTNESYEAMNIHMDKIGMAWIIDETNGFIWHNGGTDDYNSYLGFCKETDTAVVILSNLPDNYRIPATVLGTKLLMEIQK